MRRMILIAGAASAIALAAVASFLLAGDQARGQTSVNVDVGDVYFCDSSFTGGICETTVTAGDTVTWDWVGGLSHTVTQCNDSLTTCPLAGGFDSGSQGNGATFSQTFNTAGSFAYQCTIHGAGMSGRVNVAGQATPTPSSGPTPSPTQTGAAGPTASAAPTATRTTAPAAVPGTGGTPADDGASWGLLLAMAGGVLMIASAGIGVGMLRRR